MVDRHTFDRREQRKKISFFNDRAHFFLPTKNNLCLACQIIL